MCPEPCLPAIDLIASAGQSELCSCLALWGRGWREGGDSPGPSIGRARCLSRAASAALFVLAAAAFESDFPNTRIAWLCGGPKHPKAELNSQIVSLRGLIQRFCYNVRQN